MHTFYLPPEKWQEPYCLEPDEAHHLSRVLRITPGEKIRVLDGLGRMGIFQVRVSSRKEAGLFPENIWRVPRPQTRLHLALGWNKSFRRSWLLEKAVELGVWKLVFWNGRNSQGRMDQASQDNWHKKIVAAAKQSRNPWFPEPVFLSGNVLELLQYARNIPVRIVLWEQENKNNLMSLYQAEPRQDRLVAIGPEGGITRDELQVLVQDGFKTACLGPRVLRWETAALSVLCLDMFFRHSEEGTH
ncbi:RsmE family RNA methyltransferase [Desulfonatronospira sp.]|uniref:RsmE family RNA methyltransferase n=1 Tax=Desulfonatronospira sp. TaxID=1962951 RepID=UPI0025C70873|nr:RsmE family RNA methyltransferase [Desulfonatronospira sp.]